MLISDIARFIIVYVVLLVGFSTSMFVLFDRAASPDYGGPNDRLNDLGSVSFPLYIPAIRGQKVSSPTLRSSFPTYHAEGAGH